MSTQRVDLYQPIEAARAGAQPLVLRVAVRHGTDMVVGGVPSGSVKVENYVLLSALPEELRTRVVLAVQALTQGG